MVTACQRASLRLHHEPFQRSSSRRRRSRFGLDNPSRRTAAILLGFIKQFDLALQQLIFEFFPVQIQLDFAVEARLADRALVKAPPDENAWRRKRRCFRRETVSLLSVGR